MRGLFLVALLWMGTAHAQIVITGGGKSGSATIRGTFTSNGSIAAALPANTVLGPCLFHETAGNPVSVSLGTAAGGTQIMAATPIPASSNVVVNGPSLALQSWTSQQTVFVASPSWGTPAASVSVTCTYQ